VGDFLIAIPARIRSTRLPEKPLRELCGKPLIVWVVEACRRVTDNVLVATDSERVARVVRECGVEAVLTPPELPSGTERVWEAVKELDVDYIVNVQGDEPFVKPEHVLPIVEALKKAGAKRLVKLAVSGAFHSPLMEPAGKEFQKLVEEIRFHPPRIPIVFNVSAEPENNPERMRKLVARQMLSPVRWVESVEYMFSAGVRVFIEAGPKRVLSGLIRKILPSKEVRVLSVEKPEEIEKLVDLLG